MSNIKINIDVTKLDKSHFFKGKKGTYCELVIWENREGEDQYGNSHSVQQGVSKEARDKGVKGEFVGNGKWLQKKPAPQPPSRPRNNWREEKATGVPPKDAPQDDWDQDPPF